jgi:hypothetical protein
MSYCSYVDVKTEQVVISFTLHFMNSQLEASDEGRTSPTFDSNIRNAIQIIKDTAHSGLTNYLMNL